MLLVTHPSRPTHLGSSLWQVIIHRYGAAASEDITEFESRCLDYFASEVITPQASSRFHAPSDCSRLEGWVVGPQGSLKLDIKKGG